MINNVYGQLTILSFSHKVGAVKFWLCKCSCGNEKAIRQQLLTDGRTKSCGCLRKQLASERRKLDLTGKQFYNLTAIRNTNTKDSRGAYLWECLCACGKTTILRADALTRGNNKSCGCGHEKVDISNKIFGRLTVSDKYSNGLWECDCSCGNICQVPTGSLTDNRTTSCGCYQIECVKALNAAYRVAHGKDPLKAMGPRYTKIRCQFRKLTPVIRERDNYKCVLCGVSEQELKKTLHVHHIYPLSRHPALRLDTSNLVSLCPECHINKAHNGIYHMPVNEEIQNILINYISSPW